MISKCFLQTDGYQIVFNLQHLDTTKNYIDTIIEFILDPVISERTTLDLVKQNSDINAYI